MTAGGCVFCSIIRGETSAHIVGSGERFCAFLDQRPVFHGHTLVVPRDHHGTLDDLPAKEVGPLFLVVQRLARAVQSALEADGTFVAMNNHVSQSVPHLHVHVVPRRKKDGLKGFFWPRQKYASDDEMASIAAAIRREFAEE